MTRVPESPSLVALPSRQGHSHTRAHKYTPLQFPNIPIQQRSHPPKTSQALGLLGTPSTLQAPHHSTCQPHARHPKCHTLTALSSPRQHSSHGLPFTSQQKLAPRHRREQRSRALPDCPPPGPAPLCLLLPFPAATSHPECQTPRGPAALHPKAAPLTGHLPHPRAAVLPAAQGSSSSLSTVLVLHQDQFQSQGQGAMSEDVFGGHD